MNTFPPAGVAGESPPAAGPDALERLRALLDEARKPAHCPHSGREVHGEPARDEVADLFGVLTDVAQFGDTGGLTAGQVAQVTGLGLAELGGGGGVIALTPAGAEVLRDRELRFRVRLAKAAARYRAQYATAVAAGTPPAPDAADLADGLLELPRGSVVAFAASGAAPGRFEMAFTLPGGAPGAPVVVDDFGDVFLGPPARPGAGGAA